MTRKQLLHDGYHIVLYPKNLDLLHAVRHYQLHAESGMILGSVERVKARKAPMTSALLFHEDQPVGVCIVDKTNLVQVFVKEEHRNRGLGRVLVNTLKKTLRTRSAHLYACDGYNAQQSRAFWESVHIMVEAPTGPTLSNQEFDAVIQGHTSVEAIRTQRRLDYHREKGWISQLQYEYEWKKCVRAIKAENQNPKPVKKDPDAVVRSQHGTCL